MANYRASDIIRLTRNSLGMTQEELSDGICSVETLSRIENGKHVIKRKTYEQLMMKMERNPRKCYAICTGRDMEVLEERVWLEDAMAKHDFEKAERFLNSLKKKLSDTVLNRQYVLRIEALIDYYKNRIDVETLIGRLENAIRITIPEQAYNPNSLKNKKVYPFTELEILSLMSLANAYCQAHQQEKGLQIYKVILCCLETGYMDSKTSIELKMIVMTNQIKALGEKEEYENAIKKARQALTMAVEYGYAHVFSNILVSISWNMIELYKRKGKNHVELQKAKRNLRLAYYIAAAKDDYVNVRIIKKYFHDCFEGEL